MSIASCSSRPLLVLVSGKPGSGKSTLARRLADALSIPLVSRDAVRGGLAKTRVIADDDLDGISAVTLASVDVFYGTIEYLLRHGVSLVTEQSFCRGLDERHISPLAHLARTAIVHCHVSAVDAQRRFVERERSSRPDGRPLPAARTHIDRMERGIFDWQVFDPLDVDVPMLRVDTTHSYTPDLHDIVAFCGSAPPGV